MYTTEYTPRKLKELDPIINNYLISFSNIYCWIHIIITCHRQGISFTVKTVNFELYPLRQWTLTVFHCLHYKHVYTNIGFTHLYCSEYILFLVFLTRENESVPVLFIVLSLYMVLFIHRWSMYFMRHFYFVLTDNWILFLFIYFFSYYIFHCLYWTTVCIILNHIFNIITFILILLYGRFLFFISNFLQFFAIFLFTVFKYDVYLFCILLMDYMYLICKDWECLYDYYYVYLDAYFRPS
jgi:hypothetical protein